MDKKINWNELIIRNIWVELAYLLIFFIGGYTLNGFIILSIVLIAPIAIIASIIVSIFATRNVNKKVRFGTVILMGFGIGILNVLVFYFSQVMRFPFMFNP